MELLTILGNNCENYLFIIYDLQLIIIVNYFNHIIWDMEKKSRKTVFHSLLLMEQYINSVMDVEDNIIIFVDHIIIVVRDEMMKNCNRRGKL